MSTHPFRQVDVFGSGPYRGNPVAVILDADSLSDTQMQRIATWTHLSETTFVLSPTDQAADYRVRIFTVTEELPFAGHPTLGTARAWLDAGHTPRESGVVIQECGAGLVPVRIDGESLAFAAPPRIREGAVAEADLVAACERLNIPRDEVVDAAWVDNGPGWLGLLLADAQRVLDCEPDASPRPERGFYGIVGPYGAGHGIGHPQDVALEVRAFVYDAGAPVWEDPVTGSLNASLAQWLTETGRIEAPYVARQGTVMGRDGRVAVTADAGETWVGGLTHVAVAGTIQA
ncbi:PhzF family phenazine biosynthesis protein [Demequina sp. NBRC 110051]|uniref:PhzF family phenazine biosynthesis protein n=1 Tax=Demequina sp. NBRC 110051 TaxID=1570340 RepID=UPI0009FD7BF8|nr:PhzF family phenazine biosynthesis protein [Demequina sp. NBRC 110051]